ncbi:MAG: peptidoglycan DD-metalloendopeptidase family protein [Clostridiales Family XIII bacterium]|jgi:murein DD-endopeptidase MepM/ murein hydrolase activator NlpD|nr:peptidoglycan DD-metalloendopeptidase family protein [Clostridiales Family XIII bacterium]
MNPWNRIRGIEDKRTLHKAHPLAASTLRLSDGVRFVRGRLLRLRRRTGLVCARTVAAVERQGYRLADAVAPMRARAVAFLSPRLSRAASTVRLIAIAAAVIVGPPVAGAASFVSTRLSKRFGRFGRRLCIGAGGLAFAALVAVCVLILPTIPAPDTDASVRTLATGDEPEIDEEENDRSDGSSDGSSEAEAKRSIWELRINDAPVVALASQAEAESVLEQVKKSYLNGDSELLGAEIKEDVRIAEVEADSAALSELADAAAAVSYILTGTKEPKIYTVQSGDTVWEITRANGISQDELVKSNPGLIPNKLKIGQQLNLYETKPYLTIRTVEIASKLEPIAFRTNYQNSDELYKGQTKILVAGVPGAKATQTQLTKENGIVVESVELGSVITAEPQPQTALVGTKPLETFAGSGSLISPLTHIEISSGFGSRGKRRHLGVDMRSPKGSPVYAADGGVVTTSAYKGSYGNLIVLNHGSGLETYYAHCDTLLVSVGEVVAKGQQIGTVGISGNATGYHLHFEVRVNGAYQNPLNYF